MMVLKRLKKWQLMPYALDLKSKVPGMKLIINLIPFNDIGYEMYRRAVTP